MGPWNAIEIPTVERREKIYYTSDDMVFGVIGRVLSAIKSSMYKDSVQGLLLGTLCSTPYRVPVPLRAKLCDATIFDVDYSPYIYRWDTSGWRFNLSESCHITKFPVDSDTYLTNAYTFIHCSNDSPESNNLLINLSALHVQNHNLLCFGNVLVLKHSDHATTGGSHLLDLNRDEYWVIKPILEWLVSKHFFIDIVRRDIPQPKPFLFRHMSSTSNSTSSTAMNVVLRNIELLDIIMGFCGTVSLASLACASRSMHTKVSTFYGSRMSAVLGCAFSDKEVHTCLLNMLEEQRSFLGGSAAFWLLNPCSTFKIDNINILAPRGTLKPWKTFFMSLGCDTSIFDNGRQDFKPHTDSSCHFVTPLSLCLHQHFSVLPLVLSAWTTAECVLVGKNTAFCLYPSLMERNIILPLDNDRTIPQCHRDVIFRRASFFESTSRWDSPCGECCPVKWRSTVGGRDIWRFVWGDLSKGAVLIQEPKWYEYEWRRGDSCSNTSCPGSLYGGLSVIAYKT